MTGAGLFALLARVHGLVAALALALVLHPVLSLRHPGRQRPMTRLAAALGASGWRTASAALDLSGQSDAERAELWECDQPIAVSFRELTGYGANGSAKRAG